MGGHKEGNGRPFRVDSIQMLVQWYVLGAESEDGSLVFPFKFFHVIFHDGGFHV